MLDGDLQPPVGYAEPWLLYAALALLAVAGYYLAVWRLTRAGRRGAARKASARRSSLSRLQAVAGDVEHGRISPRRGHQLISETVRAFAAERTGLRARSMTLADLERQAPQELVDLVGLLYPPEFAPGEEHPREAFDEALARARELVTSWS